MPRGEFTDDHEERRAKIREVFLGSASRYSWAEAQRLTGIPAGALRRVHAEMFGRASSIAPLQLAGYALTSVWATDEVEEALGRDASALLPPLRRTRPLTIRMPEYALRYVEADLGRFRIFPEIPPRATIAAWIERVIADDLGTAADEREARLRFGHEWLRAFQWPEIDRARF